MKNFTEKFREYKSLTSELNRKLVYDPKNKRWLVTSFFSNKHIEFMRMEVVVE